MNRVMRRHATRLVEHRSAPLTELRFSNGPDGDGTFEGYLSIFSVTDSYGTRMMPGCWRAGGLDEQRLYPLLDMHATDSAVERVLGGFNAREDVKGLYIEGQWAATQAGQDARTIAGMGFAPELSVGFVRIDTLEDDPNALTVCELVEGSLIIKGMASTPGAELVAVRKRQLEERVWPPVAGSFEEKRALLNQAAKAWAAEQYEEMGDDDDVYWWVGIEATFDDSIVVCVERWGSDGDDFTEYWQLGYEVAGNSVTLGDATRVELVSEVSPRRFAAPSLDSRRRRAAAALRLSTLSA